MVISVLKHLLKKLAGGQVSEHFTKRYNQDNSLEEELASPQGMVALPQTE